MSRLWEENEGIYSLKCPEGSAEISPLASKMNVLMVYDDKGNVIDGCCQTTPIEILKSRAEESLYQRLN